MSKSSASEKPQNPVSPRLASRLFDSLNRPLRRKATLNNTLRREYLGIIGQIAIIVVFASVIIAGYIFIEPRKSRRPNVAPMIFIPLVSGIVLFTLYKFGKEPLITRWLLRRELEIAAGLEKGPGGAVAGTIELRGTGAIPALSARLVCEHFVHSRGRRDARDDKTRIYDAPLLERASVTLDPRRPWRHSFAVHLFQTAPDDEGPAGASSFTWRIEFEFAKSATWSCDYAITIGNT